MIPDDPKVNGPAVSGPPVPDPAAARPSAGPFVTSTNPAFGGSGGPGGSFPSATTTTVNSIASDSRRTATAFATRIVRWQERHGRHDLPWQATRDAYRIWLSEIMLQQTQVARVVPR